ncbi:MAG: type I 3-dehydroquinate dehydratase, partial [Planctomycetota bacterium]
SARFAALLQRCGPDDRAKFVPHAHRGEQALDLLRALDRQADPRLVAFAAGERGECTRVLAPILGSAAMYVAADQGQPTAPGQLTARQLRGAWPVEGYDGETEIAAVLGTGIAHSLSPRVHTAALRALDRNGVFVRFDVDAFRPALSGLEGLSRLRGLAVTAPFKLDAAGLDPNPSDAVRGSGAANTLRRTPAGWRADNTDWMAVGQCLDRVAGASGRLLVIGGGGAARVALAQPAERWTKEVATRRAEAARDLAEAFGATVRDWRSLDATAADVVVQCTPLGGPGHVDAAPPFDAPWPSTRALLEANYGAGPTPLVRRARAAGAAVADGRDWFLAQAVEQFCGLWAVARDDRPRVARSMAKALDAEEDA